MIFFCRLMQWLYFRMYILKLLNRRIYGTKKMQGQSLQMMFNKMEFIQKTDFLIIQKLHRHTVLHQGYSLALAMHILSPRILQQ